MSMRLTVLLLAGLATLLMACGSGAEESAAAPAAAATMSPREMSMEGSTMRMAQTAPAAPAPPAAPAAPQAAAAPVPASDFTVTAHSAGSAPSAPAASVPRPAVVREVEAESQAAKAGEMEAGGSDGERAALVAQNRIIVRTVNMNLEVDDVTAAIEEVSRSVQRDGGWVVSTDRSSKHYGFIAVRVPAEKLDAVLQWMRQIGVDVLSESSTSTDVTDEYYDLRSRVSSLQATEEALIKLLERAEKVEDALEVQRELARLQVEIESHLGRIKLLEETAAFSLVNISLNLAPQDMRVDAGEDKTFSVGEAAQFRATFYPPEDIEEFSFTWDFGDGSQVVSDTGSAPRADGGRITSTVYHVYRSDLESPFIVEVEMSGWGEAGVVEGSDTLIATVTELPAITVFAGEHRIVEEGEEVEFSGSFTRPDGLTNFRYSWEFSDGTEAVEGAPEQGATTVTATHVYENHRPRSYTVTLTVSADSEAGSVEGEASFEVFVEEARGFVVSGWSAGDNLKSAVRALSGFAQALGTAAIWLAIFSPVWLALGAVVLFAVRSRRRLRVNQRRIRANRRQERETARASERDTAVDAGGDDGNGRG